MNEPLDQRLQLVISKGQVQAVDDWRRQQPDLPSRSEAIRRLIEAGLKGADTIPIRGQKPEPSSGDDTGKPPDTGKSAPRSRKPPAPKAAPASKMEQLRALREQGAR